MTHAFDMSRFQRIIATNDTRICGSFIVHAAPSHGIFSIDPLDVTLFSEDGSWGRVVKYGDFEVDVDRETHVTTVGTIHNNRVRADIEAVRDLINEALATVVAAFNAPDGNALSLDVGSANAQSEEQNHG